MKNNYEGIITLVKVYYPHLMLKPNTKKFIRFAQQHFPDTNLESLMRFRREYRLKPTPEMVRLKNSLYELPNNLKQVLKNGGLREAQSSLF